MSDAQDDGARDVTNDARRSSSTRAGADAPHLDEWILRVQSGDRSALEQLLESLLPELRAYLRGRMSSGLRAHESSSDLAQSVCREVLVDLPRFQYPSVDGFRGWLFTTAERKVLDRYRYWSAQKRAVAREVPLLGSDSPADRELALAYGGIASPSASLSSAEEVARIERALDALSDDQRDVIRLVRFARLPHAQVAEQMGRSPDAVTSLLHRALASLAHQLCKLEALASQRPRSDAARSHGAEAG